MKDMWVLIVGGVTIGGVLGAIGLEVSDPIWWVVDVPLVLILNFYQNNIADFFRSKYKSSNTF